MTREDNSLPRWGSSSVSLSISALKIGAPQIPKKYEKNKKEMRKHFRPFSYFLSIFGAQPGAGDFVFVLPQMGV